LAVSIFDDSNGILTVLACLTHSLRQKIGI
jgi:hypothetical protein